MIGAALAASILPAHAGCVDIATTRRIADDNKGTWVELTRDQMEFARGVYVMNPVTPPGMPDGDQAALALSPTKQSGIVFFVDGALVCSSMAVPKAILDMLDDIGAAKIAHEGKPL